MTARNSARWLWLLAGCALLVPGHGARAADDAFEKRLAHASQLVRAGQFAAAEKEYLDLLRSKPNSYLLHNDLGAVYLSEQKYEPACREFLQAASLNPRLAAIQQNLGSCYYLSNMFAKAADALRRAKSLDPQDLKTRYLLGYSLLMLGRLDEAQPELEFVRAHKPGDESALFSLVRLYRQKGQEAQAQAAFSRAGDRAS
jgi:Flp pilus assembly protein TadD